MPTFTTPAVEEGMGVERGLLRFYRQRSGVSIGISGTTVTEIRYPYQGDIANYDYFYLGGYSYEVPSSVATILTNAGYGAYIT